MAANPDVLVSVEEYLRTAYSPDCDYVDGRVEERNEGETDHSRLQYEILGWLYTMADDLQLQVWPEQRVRVSEGRYRVPDICITAGFGPKPPVLTEPPAVCIEILSAEDRMPRVLGRLRDYDGAGVRHIWVIDPRERVAWVFASNSLTLMETGVLRADEIGLRLDLHERFARIDRRAGA